MTTQQANFTLMTMGRQIAASPQLDPIVRSLRQSIEGGADEEEVREEAERRLSKAGLAGLRAMDSGLTRSVRRLTLRKLLHRIAESLPKGVTVEDVLSPLHNLIGCDDWIIGVVLDRAYGRSPGPAHSLLRGQVVTIEIPIDGESYPFVYAVASPLSDPADILFEFEQHCRKLPSSGLPRPTSTEFQLKVLELYDEHGSHGRVAEVLLGDKSAYVEAWGIDEYRSERQRMIDRVKKARCAAMAFVKKATAIISPESP